MSQEPIPQCETNALEAAVNAYRSGLVDLPDPNNSRGYTTYYKPIKAMRAAIAAYSAVVAAEMAGAGK